MTRFKIEFNIDDENWIKEIPETKELVKKSCIKALEASGICKHADFIGISIMLTRDDIIQVLNKKYCNKDKPTNVLSFPSEELHASDYDKVEDELELGDIIFSLETIKSEATEQEKNITDHLCHLAVHGTLHLIGFDHQTDKEADKMEALEIKILKNLGITNPYL